MKAALFSIVPYERPVAQKGWPVAAAGYSSEVAQASMERALEFFELADQIGFDWVSVAEHHYAPGSLTPNPMVMAGAVAQRVKRAKIALLGSNIPIQNPVRVAEEFAMLDTLTGGRIIAGMLRGTSNEYVTYGVNPAESRERFSEALELIVRALDRAPAVRLAGPLLRVPHDRDLAPPGAEPAPADLHVVSSPEAAEFAAAHRISAGLRGHHRAAARRSPCASIARPRTQHGWEPGRRPRPLPGGRPRRRHRRGGLGRVAPFATPDRPAGALSMANPAIDEAAAGAGYYGRDDAAPACPGGPPPGTCRSGSTPGSCSPAADTVLAQIESIHRELGAGILELAFIGPRRTSGGAAIELFGEQVLPRMREL